MFQKIKQLIIGKPRNLQDPQIFHHISLAAFLAWVGLGADGLSSSAYGPEEAFRALGTHTHLAIFLTVMTAVTIIVISYAYSNIIEHFPGGGGGYLVATKLLGDKAGVVSGSALLVDYVLTISVSVASGCDALFSFLPIHWAPYKLEAALFVLLVLVVLNLRGVKESVSVLMPIFLFFVVSHVFVIGYALISHIFQLPTVLSSAHQDFNSSVESMGFWPVALIILKAYSMGGGTYTGIEAVSNGVGILREPRVKTAKKTMFLMAVSLAFIAGGTLFSYLLTGTAPTSGKTMNASLLHTLFSEWTWNGFSFGISLVIVILISEAVLLFVAAQTGFLDGPRVLANMALDSWMPRRFAQLSSRLVTQNGIYLMGLAAAGTLLYTHGKVTLLVTMYSINVFLTFSLSLLGMFKHYWTSKEKELKRKKYLAVHGVGLVMCLMILCITIVEKFSHGGWMTLLITGTTVLLAVCIRNHYRGVQAGLKRLDDILLNIPTPTTPNMIPLGELKRDEPTAIVAVGGFSGFGIHHILSIQRLLPNYFKNFIFVSVGVIDSGNFKGSDELQRLEEQTRAHLQKYVDWCAHHHIKASLAMATDREAIEGLEKLCKKLAKEFPRSIVFSGKLVFQNESWYQRLLHNESAVALQRQLQFAGIQTIILPIRVL